MFFGLYVRTGRVLFCAVSTGRVRSSCCGGSDVFWPSNSVGLNQLSWKNLIERKKEREMRSGKLRRRVSEREERRKKGTVRKRGTDGVF